MTDSAPIRVLLVDDHAVVRDGTAHLLRPARRHRGRRRGRGWQRRRGRRRRPEAGRGPDGPADAQSWTGWLRSRRSRPSFPRSRSSPSRASSRRRRSRPRSRRAPRATCSRTPRPRRWRRAVRAAYAGEVTLDPAVARLLAQRMRERKLGAAAGRAAHRARTRGALARGQGASNKEIAAALFITERTARTHVSNILGKLGLASRTQAALYAVENKLAERTPGA